MTRPPLQSRRLELAPLRAADADALDQVLRDRRAARFLPVRVRKETGRQFVRRVLREQRTEGGAAFAIRLTDPVETVGQIRLLNWSPTEREAEVGFWIRRKFWGRGFGTEALRLVCRHGFQTLRLHRIEAIVVVGNVGSRRVLEKVGFREEGRNRQSARLAGRWVDTWRFGLLRHEFRAR